MNSKFSYCDYQNVTNTQFLYRLQNIHMHNVYVEPFLETQKKALDMQAR